MSLEPLMAAARAAAAIQAAPPRPSQKLTWHSFDLRSGRRGVQVWTDKQGNIGRTLNEATEVSLGVKIWDNGRPVPGWQAATLPAWTMLVALDGADETPRWGGLVYSRRRTGGIWATINAVTLEAYLDRRYIGTDMSFTGSDQISGIARAVIQDTMTGALGGGIDFTIDAPTSGVVRDRTYARDDDKTVLSVLTELNGLDDGIEFTVDLGWRDDDHTVLDRIWRIRNRIGTAYTGTYGTASDRPKATFLMPGSVTDFEYLEDYSSDNGANVVLATSSGEGEARPESATHIAAGTLENGMAAFEYRFSPSTSITDIDTLDDHASVKVHEMWDGMDQLTLTADMDSAPRLGSDWNLGDDIAYTILDAPGFPAQVDPNGVTTPGKEAISRCAAWTADFDARTVAPTLLELRDVEVTKL